MAEEEKNLPQEEESPKEEIKTPWQITKESWYDKVNLTKKQLDMIVAACWILLALTVVAMYLDTTGILKIMP